MSAATAIASASLNIFIGMVSAAAGFAVMAAWAWLVTLLPAPFLVQLGLVVGAPMAVALIVAGLAHLVAQRTG